MVVAQPNIEQFLNAFEVNDTNSFSMTALGYAVLVAWNQLNTQKVEKIETNRLPEPEEILNHPDIANALAVLPNPISSKFSSWFKTCSKPEINKAIRLIHSFQDSHDFIINFLGEQLFPENEAKLKGAVFTPGWLVQHLTKKALSHWQRFNPGKGQPKLVGDLSCGPGIFLAYLRKLLPKTTKIIGIDSCPEYVCLARLLNIGEQSCMIECLDTLTDLRSEYQTTLFSSTINCPSSGYNLIVGNPPYVRSQLLDSTYAKKLRKLYPELARGNFDLVVPFLAHTINALAPGGVAALVLSSKFMNSRYGTEICRSIGKNMRVLEIMDFGDGQVFPGKTTYSCTIMVTKLPPMNSFTVIKFPPGLVWDGQGSHLSLGEKNQIPSERLQSSPWNLVSGTHEEILSLMRQTQFPRLLDVFPKISQGLRTGANSIFLLQAQAAKEIESELLRPYISGENIRRCFIKPLDKYLLFPYDFDSNGVLTLLSAEELEQKYPKAWAFLQQNRQELMNRDLEASTLWYGYSRSQNLRLQNSPKILIREMMPRAEFAADFIGKYAFSSGYALIPSSEMSVENLRLWVAILCTPTMEFQIRYCSTQLHSGWFRSLKQHLSRLRLPSFSTAQKHEAYEFADLLHNNPDNCEALDALDSLVSQSFNLTEPMRDEIHKCLEKYHTISLSQEQKGVQNNKIYSATELNPVSHQVSKTKSDFCVPEHISQIPDDLTVEQRQRYIPVELPAFYELHYERYELGKLVTFQKNKNAPVHRWFKFTQGFSGELVKRILEEEDLPNNPKIYDPFAGSGTTLLVSRLMGIESFGSEISPFLSWVSELKFNLWNPTELHCLVNQVKLAKPQPSSPKVLLFQSYFKKAYSPEILSQICGWRDWINQIEIEHHLRKFFLLGLVSILEEVSNIRKHGSHYRFLNNPNSAGLLKLNISVIDSSTDVKPILIKRLESMIADVEACVFKQPLASCAIYTMDSRVAYPLGHQADMVITSPPYLNRNNYMAQQKAELSILKLIETEDDYKKLVKNSFSSHVESELKYIAQSNISEVNEIVGKIELSENNNPKIPHMICGYFDDLQNTLEILRKVVKPGGKLAFVVGNSRWGGVVVPVDHLLALIAQRLGYDVERILVTRLKGNSPQQMRRYGRIPNRESIVMLQWNGS